MLACLHACAGDALLFFDMDIEGTKGDRKALHASCPTTKVRLWEQCGVGVWMTGHVPCSLAHMLLHTYPQRTLINPTIARPFSYLLLISPCLEPTLISQGTKWTATKWIHNKPYMGSYDAIMSAGACKDLDLNCPQRVRRLVDWAVG